METLAFEPSREADIPLIAEILTEATQLKIGYDDNSWGSEPWTDEEVKDMMNEGAVYLVKQGDEAVATVSLKWKDERIWGEHPNDAGYLYRMAVRKGHQGQGLGEQMLAWADMQVSNNGRQLLRLDCESANEKLCAYYENQGFKRVGTNGKTALYERPVKNQKA